MFIGAMMVANPSQAGGGGGIGLEIHIKDGLETQAVYVGLAILIAVYVLIIFETVHRTLAAAVGGVVAMLAAEMLTLSVGRVCRKEPRKVMA